MLRLRILALAFSAPLSLNPDKQSQSLLALENKGQNGNLGYRTSLRLAAHYRSDKRPKYHFFLSLSLSPSPSDKVFAPLPSVGGATEAASTRPLLFGFLAAKLHLEASPEDLGTGRCAPIRVQYVVKDSASKDAGLGSPAQESNPFAQVAQMVEQPHCRRMVAGSIPALGSDHLGRAAADVLRLAYIGGVRVNRVAVCLSSLWREAHGEPKATRLSPNPLPFNTGDEK